MKAASEAGIARLHYLGTAGVAHLKGLNVAYLDGLSAPKGQAASGTDSSALHGGRYHCQVYALHTRTLSTCVNYPRTWSGHMHICKLY